MPVAKLIAPTTKQEIPKLRVAAYCRVSSNSADQRNSFATQERVYTKYIAEKQEWELVDIFADEGLSGMKADNRPEFQRMIRMCELHQIDLILTKSVSRFARNVKEALSYTRKLKLLGVGVQFEEDGVNTLAMADEMLLNTFAAIAQEESKSISQNQRLSIVKRMESGEYIASNAPYGYRLIDKKLVIYEPEAEVVRWIFAAYLNGMSTVEIAHELSAKSVPTKGKKEQWKANRIAYILSNEKYDGDTLFQKYYGEETVPFKKHRNYGEVDQFFARNTHDAILPQGMFQAVQTLLQSRGRKFGKRMTQAEYPLTSRIRCSECGAFYHRKVRNGTVKWVCSRHAADTAACDSHYYSETRIYDGIITIINKLLENAKYTGDAEFDAIIEDAVYEEAVAAKSARRWNRAVTECEGIRQLRDHIRCGNCGAPMLRHINSKRAVRESWTCSNTACGLRVRISDGELLQKVTLLMNRIIENADLLLPHEIVRRTDSPAVQELQQQIANEMLREQPDEQRIVDLLREIAGQLYRQTNAKTQIAAQIARKRAALMHPQDAFNSACFSSLIDAVSLSAGGSVILHTKTQTEIYESEDKPNGSTENPKADSHPD